MESTEPRAPVLAAFSPGTAAREPVEFGLAASRFTGAPLVVVAVNRGGPLVEHFGGGGVTDNVGDEARAIEHLRLDLERGGHRNAQLRVVQDRTVAGGLKAAIAEHKPELVVVGSTGRGAVGAVLVGSTAERVIHESSSPVAVVPNGYKRPEGGVRTVGVAFAPTAEGRDALHVAAVLARLAGAQLRVLRVLEPDRADTQAEGLMASQHREVAPEEGKRARGRLDAERELRDEVAELSKQLKCEVDVLVNDPADGLVAASKQLDMLVMGSRAQGPKRAVLLGSVSRKVTERAACPVLVIPRGTAEASETLISGAEAEQTR
jgi:nucleotide-binding universal stress UspA family protein